MSYDRFVREYPNHTIVQRMRNSLPDNYKYYLVDHIILDCVPGLRTCVDISWHFDGDFYKDNQYCLYIAGPNRTLFSNHHITHLPPRDRAKQGQWLNALLDPYPSEPVTEQTIFHYTSKTPHRGVICTEYGIRDFTRVMCSNYVQPKNITRR